MTGWPSAMYSTCSLSGGTSGRKATVRLRSRSLRVLRVVAEERLVEVSRKRAVVLLAQVGVHVGEQPDREPFEIGWGATACAIRPRPLSAISLRVALRLHDEVAELLLGVAGLA